MIFEFFITTSHLRTYLSFSIPEVEAIDMFATAEVNQDIRFFVHFLEMTNPRVGWVRILPDIKLASLSEDFIHIVLKSIASFRKQNFFFTVF